MPDFPRITIKPEQMDGVPCIRGMRIPVVTVVRMVRHGMTAGEILDLYPDLEAEDIVEALRFAAEQRRDNVGEIIRQAQEASALSEDEAMELAVAKTRAVRHEGKRR